MLIYWFDDFNTEIYAVLLAFPARFKEVTKSYKKSIPWGLLNCFLVNDKAVFMSEIINVEASFPVTPIARNMGTAECIKLFEVPENKSRFTWHITRFSSFTGKRHSSYEFTVGPRRWYENDFFFLIMI